MYLSLAEHVQLKKGLMSIANMPIANTNPVALIQPFNSYIQRGLPDTVASKRLYHLASTKESREETS